MRLQLKEAAGSIKGAITKDVRGRMVGVMLDLGSRFGKSFLGVSIQYMDNLTIKIAHLGMIVMRERKTAVFIRKRLEEILALFGMTLMQIHTITTDNGANVIKTQQDILNAIALMVAESDEGTEDTADADDMEVQPEPDHDMDHDEDDEDDSDNDEE